MSQKAEEDDRNKIVSKENRLFSKLVTQIRLKKSLSIELYYLYTKVKATASLIDLPQKIHQRVHCILAGCTARASARLSGEKRADQVGRPRRP